MNERIPIIGGAFAVGLLGPALGSAQGVALEEVVVTAERRESSLQDAPISVAVISAQQLEELAITQPQDLGHQIPNLNITPARTSGGASLEFDIRGAPGVALYIDDVYFPSTSAASLRTVDLESIEVLRGPQGTLFGRNSIGGAIRVQTRKPSDVAYANVDVRVGELGTTDFQANLNYPLTDTLFVKGYIGTMERDGYITRVGVPGEQGHNMGSIDDEIASAALRWVPTDDIFFDLTLRREENHGNTQTNVGKEFTWNAGSYGLAEAGELNAALVRDGQAPLAYDDPRLGLGDYTTTGYCFVHDLDPLSWDSLCDTGSETENTLVTAAVTWDLNANHSLKISAGNFDVEDMTKTDWTVWGGQMRFVSSKFDATSVEAVLNSSLADGALNLVTGAFYYDEKQQDIMTILANNGCAERTTCGNRFLDADTDTRQLEDNRRDIESLGIFAQGTYNFSNDRTSLTLGIRATEDEETARIQEFESGTLELPGCMTASSEDGVPGMVPGIPGNWAEVRDPACSALGAGNDSWSSTDYRISLDHQFTDNVMAYVAYSTAYQAGTINTPVATTGDPFVRPTFGIEPQEMDNTEFGIRSEWLDNRLRLNFTVFDQDHTNRLGGVQDPNATSVVFVTVNLPDNRFYGWEMDTSFAANASWTFNLALARAVGDVPEPDGSSRGYFVEGVPEYSVNVGARYAAAIAGGQLTANINYNWQDEERDTGHEESNVFTNFTDAYGLLNARVAYQRGNIVYAIGATNLADEVYAVKESRFADFFFGPGRPTNGDRATNNTGLYWQMGPPRVIYASVTVGFGN